MNLNDLRANAYVNMSKEENKDKKKNENPVVKAFMPPVVHRETGYYQSKSKILSVRYCKELFE